MNDELMEEKAQLYALGLLPESEVADFEKRIREDRETQSIVHEYQRLNEMSASDSSLQPSFQAFSGIMERIDSDRSEDFETAQSASWAPLLTWGGWAVAACVTAIFGFGLLDSNRADPAHSDIVLNNLSSPAIVEVATPSDSFEMEDRMLELAGLAEAYWFARDGVPNSQLLDAASTEVAELSGGFTIFDRRHNIGFIAVENLPRESLSKSYHVWAKATPEAAPVRAGTLPIGDDSRGLFFFDLRHLPQGASVDSLSFFVTEEDSATPQQPSGMVVLRDV